MLSALRSLFSRPASEAEVHFHLDSAGRPAVCEFRGCDRPHLSVD